jgi:hypothetical protein
MQRLLLHASQLPSQSLTFSGALVSLRGVNDVRLSGNENLIAFQSLRTPLDASSKCYNIRSDEEGSAAREKLQFLRAATGSFLRYRAVAEALRDLNHAAGWYIAQDMKHESKAEFEEARRNVTDGFAKLIAACDETLKSAPKRL